MTPQSTPSVALHRSRHRSAAIAPAPARTSRRAGASHLTFREIGARLHVSTNTVKTQALAVYRKLGASCRSEAVAHGRSVGLIDG